MKVIPASDSSLLVVFGNEISPALHERVIALFHSFQARHDPRIRNLHPGYASLLIDFDPLQMTHEELRRWSLTADTRERLRRATVRQCRYHSGVLRHRVRPRFGRTSRMHAGISVEEVVRIHSSPTYLVYFLGFSPGFVYLGGLPQVLHAPRLATPRPSIAGGKRRDCRQSDRNLSV